MTHIHKKAFTRRFVLTVEESHKFPTFIKNKATMNAPLDVIYLMPFLPLWQDGCQICLHLREAFALLVSTNRAMREPFSGGAGDR